jgi:large subunit ribosomal protein L22
MMQAKAMAKWVRVSPDRARLVAREIQGKSVDEALMLVQYAKAKGARAIRKVLESAVANAEHNYEMDVDRLIIREARIDHGPVLKRMKPRSRGRADILRRPTSHITIVVEERQAR